MKKRITITIDEDALEKLESYIDGVIIQNRSQAIEVAIRRENLKRFKL